MFKTYHTLAEVFESTETGTLLKVGTWDEEPENNNDISGEQIGSTDHFYTIAIPILDIEDAKLGIYRYFSDSVAFAGIEFIEPMATLEVTPTGREVTHTFNPQAREEIIAISRKLRA